MILSTWAIRHPVPPLALFLVLLVAGLVSFRQVPITQFPDIDIPIVTVDITQQGAAPRDIATQILAPVETAIWNVAGVKHVASTATDSHASLTVEFRLGTDTNRALSDVKDAVSGARANLPASIRQPIIRRLDVFSMPILTFAVEAPGRPIDQLSWFVDNTVAREVGGAQGVGKVSRQGGAKREIKVELDPARLRALGITAADVSRRLRAVNVDLGGGRGDLAGEAFAIRILGSAASVAQLAATPLALPSGATVRLDDLGQVIDGPAEARSFAMFDSQPVVSFSVYRASGASDLVAGDAAKARVAKLAARYPDVKFSLIDDETVYTRGSFNSAMDTLYEGGVLAVIVVFLFLRSWRATLITALALPLSIIPTFLVMNLLGFSLNGISLLGITLVTGILVDDAIVEIENISRHIRMGRPAYEASMEAAREIGLTVIAISFTIVAVFAPVSFMGGIAGQYFRQFGLTVAVAVLFSLLVARLITPMLAAYFMRSTDADEAAGGGGDGWAMRRYLGILRWTLHHRVITLLIGVVIFAVSIYSATLLPTAFIPPSDTGRSRATLELPPGATLNDTRATARDITRRLRQIPEVVSVFVNGGAGGVEKATLTINYGPKTSRKRGAALINRDIRARLAEVPDARLFLLKQNGQRDITINILGDSEAAARAAATRLIAGMRGLADIRNPASDTALSRPEIQIIPKPERAARLGVSAADLATTIRVATIGDYSANLAKFSTGERQIPIVVRLAQKVRHDLVLMAGQRIPGAGGKPVALGAVADIVLGSGPSSVARYDRRYRVSVAADLARGAILGPALGRIHALPEARKMPAGTSIQNAGDAQIMGQVFSSFGLAMGAGVMMVYVVLVLLFGSFIMPLTILLSLPLAIGGAIFALYLGGFAISLSVVIGFLMLMGIVTKNAIMLVEFGLAAMQGGADSHTAMLDAGHKRARPIIMTTIAMTAGMLPSALAIGAGGNFRAPMAVAVIGGLLLSTLLSLLFVPSLFSLIDAGRGRLGRALARGLRMNSPRKKTV